MRKSLLLAVSLILFAAACASDPKQSRDEYFKSGQEYLEAKKFEEARIQFLNALKLDNSYVPAHLGLASAYEGLGNLQNAVAELRRVIDRDSTNIEAKLRLGRYYLAAGMQDPKWFKEAGKLAQEVLDAEPDNVQAMILLGNSYAGQQDFDKSIETMEKALTVDPDNLDAAVNMGASRFAARQPEEAEKVFLEAVQKHPDSLKALLALGNFYAFSGSLDKAEETFRKAHEMQPEDSRAFLALVRVYVAQKEPDKAIGVFQNAVKSSKNPVPVQMALANFYLSQQRTQDALDLLQKVHSENPDREDVALRLAEVEQGLGHTADATKTVDALLETNQNSGAGHLLKARLEASQKNYDGARAQADRAIQLSPNLVDAYLLKTDLQQRQGDLPGAEQTVRKALEIDGGNIGARARLAKLMAVMKRSKTDLENALTEAQTILSLQPQNTDALAAQAEAMLGLGRLDDARTHYEDLHEAYPDNPFYTHRLGSIAALQGKPDLALQYFRQALQGNPNLTDVVNDIVAVMMQQGKAKQALAELDQMQAKAADQKWMFHLYKGRIYISEKQFDQAEAELRQAMQLNPDSYQSYMLLGQMRLQQNRYDDAVKEIDDLLQKKPDFAPAYLMKAYFNDAAKNTQGAIADYRKSIDLFDDTDPGYGAAANNLAWLLATQGQSLSEARTLAEKARAIDPNNPHYADTLGWVYYLMGNYTLAVDQLLFSVNQGNHDAQHYYRLGMAYFRKGDTIHAKQTLQTALSINTKFEGADEARKTLEEIGN